MRVLLIGDAHIKINNFQTGLKFLSWLNQLIKDQKPDLVVNLGDFFNDHAVVRSEVMTEFMNHVNYVRNLGIPYVYVVGNHCMFKPNDSKYHALKHLVDAIPNLHIVDEVKDLYDITFVPYMHDPSNFPKHTKSICVAHQTFKGADYGDITTQDGVDASLVSADVIISGHIHKKQVLDKVIYPGSPFSQSVNDIDQVKGITIFDTRSYKQEFFVSPTPMWRGLRFEISPSLTCDDIHSQLETSINGVDNWIVEITGPKAEIVGYLNSKKCKELFDGINIKVKPIITDKEKKLVHIKASSIDSIINEYIDRVYAGALDKAELKTKSMELLAKIGNS